MSKHKLGLIVVIVVVVVFAGIFIFRETTKAPDLCCALEDMNPDQNVSSSLIRVQSPRPNEVMSSTTIKVIGSARGTWFFEASFPVKLMVGDRVIAQGIAQAQSDWMTTDFVPFTATLNFEYIFGSDRMPALLVLEKDNPSDMRQYDASISIPIVLTPGVSGGAISGGKCFVGGCSGQICSDKADVVSTCEYTAAYACYKTAVCERQAGGACGWTQTAQLQACLKNPPAVN